jgi:molecular chaperone DnaK (HSP70)
MAKVIGVDLGTTNTVVAVMDGAKPRVIENREGSSELRSVISLKSRKDRRTGRIHREELVGHVAEDNSALEPVNTVFSIKRLMGRGMSDPEVRKVSARYRYRIVEPADGTRDSIRVLLDDQPLSPTEVSAKILRRAKEDAERACGGEVRYAVITVPAYFSEAQRDATKRAGVQAGLHVVKLLDEPTAAAVAFGIDERTHDEAKTILVFDLGGGTFDVSILVMAGSVFAPLALKGDMWLGGDDFDQKLIDLAVDHVREQYGVDAKESDRFMVELRKAARITKERLSTSSSADLIVPGLLRDPEGNLIDLSMDISREELEELVRPLVERAMSLTRRAIEDANLTPARIDCVLLAGNSSRLPMIRNEIARLFGAEKILRTVSPKHSVALGAAIVGARIGERIICQAPDPAGVQTECGHVNRPEATHCERVGCSAPLPIAADDAPVFPAAVAPFHYGAQTIEDRFNLFVRKGDPYPTVSPRTQVFGTTRPNQRIITVPVFGGEDLDRASNNDKQGEAVAILPQGLPKGTSIAITLWLNEEGLFELTARLSDGTDLQAFKTKGEADAKAIAIVLEVEQRLAGRDSDSSSLRIAAEQAANRVFEKLREGDPEGALREAELARSKLSERAEPEPGDEQRRRESVLTFCESVVKRYRWIDPGALDGFARVVEQTRAVLEQGAPAASKFTELDRAWSALPENVRRFPMCRHAILTRIRPVDLAAAARLERDLEGMEQAFKGQNPRATDWWEGFTRRLNSELERAERERPAGVRCFNGHEVPPGHRYCPVRGCGVDVTGLMHKGGSQRASSATPTH